MKFKLYIFDIDGTILTTEHKVLPSTKKAMELLKTHGGQVMLASARPPKAIEPIACELGFDPFYISLNGALIVRDNKILYEDALDYQTTQDVIERAKWGGLSVNVYSTWDWFIEEKNYWSRREGTIVGYQGTVCDLSKIEKSHKLLLIGEPDRVLQVQKELQAEVPNVSGSLSSPYYLEVVAKDASKAQGLKIVGELLKVDMSEIVAFGDGENDLPMIEAAGFSVAMDNGHPVLKEKADLVTASNDEDGIWNSVVRILDLDQSLL